MADHEEKKHEESLMEKISERIHGHDSSPSSDSDNEKSSPSSVKFKIYRLFGRERPVHKVLDDGKLLLVMLNKATLSSYNFPCANVITLFQLCVLDNLCPETVEEAIAMVPSIKAIVVFVISINACAYEKSEMEELSMVALSGCIWLQAFDPGDTAQGVGFQAFY